MLKELKQLMSKRSVSDAEAESTEGATQTDSETSSTTRTASEIDPVSLEAELRNELHAARVTSHATESHENDDTNA